MELAAEDHYPFAVYEKRLLIPSDLEVIRFSVVLAVGQRPPTMSCSSLRLIKPQSSIILYRFEANAAVCAANDAAAKT